MHIDFNSNSEIPENNIDFCIIGSGAAGTVLFDILSKSYKHRLLLIESGDIKPNSISQELNSGEILVNGKKLSYDLSILKSALETRIRGFGGSTNCWSGNCTPFSSFTFKKRDWIKYSGWDIEENEISQYYNFSNKYTEISSSIFDDKAWNLIGRKNFLSSDDEIKTSFSIRSGYLNSKSSAYLDWPGPVIFSKYLFNTEIINSKNNNILYNATVIDFSYDLNFKSIKSCTVINSLRLIKKIYAKCFILCCGGFENPRLLLIGNQGKGIGNIYGAVGRFYTAHPHGVVADLICDNTEIATKIGLQFQNSKINNNRCSPYLTVSENSQKKYNLLNTAFNLTPELDPTSASFKIKNIIEKISNNSIKAVDFNAHDLYLILLELDDVLKNSFRKIANIGAELRLNKSIPITYIAEGIPKSTSKVYLSNEKDKNGVNKIIYNWDYNNQEQENLYTSLKLLASTAKKYSWGRIQIREQSLPESGDVLKGLIDAAHPSGGTRISNNPKYGVVDSNLKVHFIDNLFVCGSSIFPTNGHEPPTYTIVAFAARLAIYLESKFSN